MNPVVFGAQELADAHGVTRQTIFDWTNAGMPKIADGQYDVVASFQWRLDRERARYEARLDDAGLEEQETRWKRAQADLKELELAEKRKIVVSVSSVMAEWDRILSSAKTNLLGIPSKVAVKVRAARDAAEIKTIIESEILYALGELTRHTGAGGSAAEGDGELGVPADALAEKPQTADSHDRKRVGRRKAVHPTRGKSRRARKVADVKG